MEFGGGGKGVVDEDGWQYSDFPYAGKWYGEKKMMRTSRRRRWVARLERVDGVTVCAGED